MVPEVDSIQNMDGLSSGPPIVIRGAELQVVLTSGANINPPRPRGSYDFNVPTLQTRGQIPLSLRSVPGTHQVSRRSKLWGFEAGAFSDCSFPEMPGTVREVPFESVNTAN